MFSAGAAQLAALIGLLEMPEEQLDAPAPPIEIEHLAVAQPSWVQNARDKINWMFAVVTDHQPQHDRRLAELIALWPEIDDILRLASPAQLAQQPHVGADAQQQMTAAVEHRLRILVADETGVYGGHRLGRHFR